MERIEPIRFILRIMCSEYSSFAQQCWQKSNPSGIKSTFSPLGPKRDVNKVWMILRDGIFPKGGKINPQTVNIAFSFTYWIVTDET